MTLMNQNYVVAEMEGEIEHRENSPFPCLRMEKLSIVDRIRCPLCLLAGQGEDICRTFNSWMEKRCISIKRRSLKALPNIHWDRGNPNFLSMSDQYWVRYSEDETWEKLNFYHNCYSNIIGLASGSYQLGAVKTLMFPHNSPDLCTNGIQDKMWMRLGEENYLIKWSTQKDQQTILSEVLAAETLRQLNIIPFVDYELIIENYRLCTRCKNFVPEGQEFVPAWHAYRAYECEHPDKIKKSDEIYEFLMEAIKHFEIPDMKDFIDKMIIVDRIIMNFDRHLGNFGFMRDVNTGKFIGPAPLFDFGSAFFPDKNEMKKDRYIFGARAKQLLPLEKTQNYLGKMKDISKDEIWSIPEFASQKDIVVRNVNLNSREIGMLMSESLEK